ncbi:MAG: hypothetical protein Q4F28_15575 [Eubacteriales bacterium]|nr:hypothetical protein [Eubacteriales bacterium]
MVHSSPGIVCICIDSYRYGNSAGRLYHGNSAAAIPFQSVVELVADMEELFDEINFPEASTRARAFRGSKKQQRQRRGDTPMARERNILNQKGELATFVVHVQYRQNATWQGEVLWADKNEKVSFRSALELLKLMDGAMGGT